MTREVVAALMANIGGANTVQWKSIPQGAATTLFALLSPELLRQGGAYCEDCSVATVSDDAAANSGVRPYALDPARAEQLWQLSDAAVGLAGAH
jgi:hypothetical protein